MDIIKDLPTNLMDFLKNITLIEGCVVAVVALFFGIVATGVVGLILWPVFAVAIYLAADAVIPPLMNHTAIVMPTFDKAYLQEAITLYVLFLVAIVVVFALKKIVRSVF